MVHSVFSSLGEFPLSPFVVLFPVSLVLSVRPFGEGEREPLFLDFLRGGEREPLLFLESLSLECDLDLEDDRRLPRSERL